MDEVDGDGYSREPIHRAWAWGHNRPIIRMGPYKVWIETDDWHEADAAMVNDEDEVKPMRYLGEGQLS